MLSNERVPVSSFKGYDSLIACHEDGGDLQGSDNGRLLRLRVDDLPCVGQNASCEYCGEEKDAAWGIGNKLVTHCKIANFIHRNTERHEGERESARLVQRSSHGGADNHADAEEGLKDGEHGGHVLGELLGDHAEGAGEETAISAGLDNPEREIM